MREAARLTLRGFKVWWKENPKMLAAPLLQGMVEALSPYGNLWLLARLIDEIAGPKDGKTLTVLVLTLLVSSALLSLLAAGLGRWKNTQWAGLWHVQNKIINHKLLTMDFASVEDAHTQELRSQIWQNTDSGGLGLYKLLNCFESIVCSVLSIAGGIVLTASLFFLPVKRGDLSLLNHPAFLIVIAAVLAAVTFFAPVFSVKAGSYWGKYAEENKFGNRLFGFWLGALGDDMSKALDVRIYRQDILSKHCLEKYNPFAPAAKLPKAARGPMGGYLALSEALAQGFIGTAYLYVCLKALGGAFDVGSVVRYVSALTALSGGLSKLLSTLGDLKNNAAFLRVVFEFLDIPNGMHQGSQTIESCKGQQFEIEFRNVSFQYPGQRGYALRDVSFTFRAGRRLAVVGRNGSGKTTFIKLLCRLYDPTEGEILLNGVDIRGYDYREYLSLFSVIFQDFKLLSFPLGQNVAGSSDCDEEKAERCLWEAGFGERLGELPKGLSTSLYKDFEESGVNISGGEAQKIALARALYKDAPFLLLDEPTAALDPIAESEIYTRIGEQIKGKAVVFISHRLSSCRFCQDIAVFHEGQMVQRGSHDSLVSDKGGIYNTLWEAQAQYYGKSGKRGGPPSGF